IESGLTRTAVTNEAGGYNVPALPVGPYEITSDLVGFKKEVRRGINLVVGQEAVVNMTLEVGGGADQVSVTEEAPLVNTTLTFGNVARGRFTGPGFYNLDTSLFKRIPLKEKLNLQFR